jgi:hypothetical protein
LGLITITVREFTHTSLPANTSSTTKVSAAQVCLFPNREKPAAHLCLFPHSEDTCWMNYYAAQIRVALEFKEPLLNRPQLLYTAVYCLPYSSMYCSAGTAMHYSPLPHVPCASHAVVLMTIS